MSPAPPTTLSPSPSNPFEGGPVLTAAIVAALISLVTTLAVTPPHIDEVLVRHVGQSVAMLSIEEQGACTAFSVGEGEFLTAAHCFVNDGLYWAPIEQYSIEGWAVEDHYLDAEVDLAWFRSGLVLPPLPLARRARISEPLLVFGHTFGEDAMAGVVFGAKEVEGELWLWGGVEVGMSGGPVVDARGDVVSMVQWTDERTGRGRHPLSIGPTPKVMREFLKEVRKR